MNHDLVRAAEREAAWRHYVQDVYRLGSLELVARELDRKDLAPRAKSARLAWTRRRVQGLEPLDCGQEVRKELDHYKPTLDQFNTARDALVCCPMGENDHFHNIFWAESEGESEKKILDAGSQLLRRQLDDTCNPVVATALHNAAIRALVPQGYYAGILYRLLQHELRHEYLRHARLDIPISEILGSHNCTLGNTGSGSPLI